MKFWPSAVGRPEKFTPVNCPLTARLGEAEAAIALSPAREPLDVLRPEMPAHTTRGFSARAQVLMILRSRGYIRGSARPPDSVSGPSTLRARRAMAAPAIQPAAL